MRPTASDKHIAKNCMPKYRIGRGHHVLFFAQCTYHTATFNLYAIYRCVVIYFMIVLRLRWRCPDTHRCIAANHLFWVVCSRSSMTFVHKHTNTQTHSNIRIDTLSQSRTYHSDANVNCHKFVQCEMIIFDLRSLLLTQCQRNNCWLTNEKPFACRTSSTYSSVFVLWRLRRRYQRLLCLRCRFSVARGTERVAVWTTNTQFSMR